MSGLSASFVGRDRELETLVTRTLAPTLDIETFAMTAFVRLDYLSILAPGLFPSNVNSDTP